MYKLISLLSVFFLTTLSADGHLSLFFSEFFFKDLSTEIIKSFKSSGFGIYSKTSSWSALIAVNKLF